MDAGMLALFPRNLRSGLSEISVEDLEEIRLRAGRPVELIYRQRSQWLNGKKEVEASELKEMFSYITGYSGFAMEEELLQGFVTVCGGHRVGMAGQGGRGSCGGISGINFRIAREKIGCAKRMVPWLRKGEDIYNTILFAPPGVGKTTYLRDIIRLISDGDESNKGLVVSCIDERSEIAACRDGKPQYDLGRRTDVLDACPKAVGMQMVLRTMSPRVIAVDEVGTKEELRLIRRMQCSGVRMIGTIHAGSLEELFENPWIREGQKEDLVERLIWLRRDADGQRSFVILNGKGELLCRG